MPRDSYYQKRKCVVQGCGNLVDYAKGINLHAFPFVNDTRPEAAERLQRWVDFVHERTPEWSASRAHRCYICSVHFSAQDFTQMFTALPGLTARFTPRLIRDELGIKAYPKFQVESSTEEVAESNNTRTSKRIQGKEQLQTILTNTEKEEIGTEKSQNQNSEQLDTDVNRPINDKTLKRKSGAPSKASKKLKATKKNPVTSGRNAVGDQTPQSEKVKKRKSAEKDTSESDNAPDASKQSKTARPTARKSRQSANITGKTQSKKKTSSNSQPKSNNPQKSSNPESVVIKTEVSTENEDIDSKDEIRKQIAMDALVEASLGCIAQEVKQEIEEQRQQEKLEQSRLGKIAWGKAREKEKQRIQKQREEMIQKRLEAKQRNEQKEEEEKRLQQEEMERETRKRKWREQEQLEKIKKNEEIIERISELEAGIHSAKKKQKDCQSKVTLLKEKINTEVNCREPDVLEIPQGVLVPHVLKAVEKHLMGDKCKEVNDESDIHSSETTNDLGDNVNKICSVKYKSLSANKTVVNLLLIRSKDCKNKAQSSEIRPSINDKGQANDSNIEAKLIEIKPNLYEIIHAESGNEIQANKCSEVKTNNFESQVNRTSTQLPMSPHLPGISTQVNATFTQLLMSPNVPRASQALPDSPFNASYFLASVTQQCGRMDQSYIQLATRESQLKSELQVEETKSNAYEQEVHDMTLELKKEISRTKMVLNYDEYRRKQEQVLRGQSKSYIVKTSVKKIEGDKELRQSEPQNARVITLEGTNKDNTQISDVTMNEVSTQMRKQNSETTITTSASTQPGYLQSSTVPNKSNTLAIENVVPTSETTEQGLPENSQSQDAKAQSSGEEMLEATITVQEHQVVLTQTASVQTNIYDSSNKRAVCVPTTEQRRKYSSVKSSVSSQSTSTVQRSMYDSGIKRAVWVPTTNKFQKDSSVQTLIQTASIQTNTYDSRIKRTVWYPTRCTETIQKDSSVTAKNYSNYPVTAVPEPQLVDNTVIIEAIQYDHGQYTKNPEATTTVIRVTPVYYPGNTKEKYIQTLKSGCDVCKSTSTEQRRVRHRNINIQTKEKKRNQEMRKLRCMVEKLEANQVARDKELEEATEKMKEVEKNLKEAEKNLKEQKQLVYNYERREELRKKDKERRNNEKERKKRAKERKLQLRERRKLAKLRKKE